MSMTLILREFERVYEDDPRLQKEGFKALRRFALSRTEEQRVLGLGVEKGREYISSRNYVGLLTLPDGLQIEILPKLPLGKEASDQQTRAFFFHMLQTCGMIPGVAMEWSGLSHQHGNMLECFYAAYLDSLQILLQQGLASGYHPYTENERFLKGRLDISSQIKYNFAHRERFYVTYDVFDTDRVENRLLKTALQQISRRTSSLVLRRQSRILLDHMAGIPESADPVTDFTRCAKNDRNMARYHQALAWCRLFLLDESFTAFSGDEETKAILFPMERIFQDYVAISLETKAILFPMERIFQDYVAISLAKCLSEEEWEFRVQGPRKYLFYEAETGRFQLKPDIYIRKKKDSEKRCLIMDTKWKRLDAEKQNYGISQADMYQMYAYGKKYHAEKVVLLYPYPYSEGALRLELEEFYSRKIGIEEETPLTVQIKFVKLDRLDELVKYVQNYFEK